MGRMHTWRDCDPLIHLPQKIGTVERIYYLFILKYGREHHLYTSHDARKISDERNRTAVNF